MKPLHFFLLMTLSLLLLPSCLHAQDMRALQQEAQLRRLQLEKEAAAEKQAAMAEELHSREQILNDKAALDKSIADLRRQVQQLKHAVTALDAENRQLAIQDQQLTEQLAAADGMVREVVGVIRLNAKDLTALVRDDLQSGVNQPDVGFLATLVDQAHFPGMVDIRQMIDLLFDRLRASGEVSLSSADIIDRSGRAAQAQVLTIGPFTALYRLGDEVGFLNYSAAGGNLYALSRLPSGRQERQMRDYMQGESDAVPLDVSRGAALQQLVHRSSLGQQILRGGILVWPILAILVIGCVIIVERLVFLSRKRLDGDRLIQDIEILVGHQDWPGCQRLCAPYAAKPVARVMQAGLSCRNASREDMEDVLQEAILKEIPAMERFLETLGMLAAIAPLLGLLGTVTGMIDTFEVMTLFGTGDPRMMSGGISVALVTTMLGLTVAIPIMLAHTLLGRAVDNAIGQLEEKAVALVNIIQKNR